MTRLYTVLLVLVAGLSPFASAEVLPTLPDSVIAAYRNMGPAGLAKVLETYDASHNPALIRQIDAVAGQRGAVWSRLYWYTDLEQAKAVAKAQHKPILYLRLMGKLTDEYSCANSRFFRTVLYANTEVSALLREKFVLVWCSERPVPVVTIDYGDGRVLKRTLTGNSIHYILDPDGNVVDALPGLYGPAAFESILKSNVMFASQTTTDSERVSHAARENSMLRLAWNLDVTPGRTAVDESALSLNAPSTFSSQATAGASAIVLSQRGLFDPAGAAMGRTSSKCIVEAPLLRAVSAATPVSMGESGAALKAVLRRKEPTEFPGAIDRAIDSADARTWDRVAALHAAEARLDANSIALIRSQNPDQYKDSKVLDRTVAQFQSTIAQDTVRNDYAFRRQILSWIGDGRGSTALNDLNQRVYTELFLTPRSDPWLGLVTESTYSGLERDGAVATGK